MTVAVALSITFDDGLVQERARRRGLSFEQMARETASLLEGRAFDSVRWVDGVERVGSNTHITAESRDESESNANPRNTVVSGHFGAEAPGDRPLSRVVTAQASDSSQATAGPGVDVRA